MTTDSLESNRLLAEIGISEPQERAYRLLLARGVIPAHEVAEALQLPSAQALALLIELERHGLVIRAPGPELHFLPSTPEVAVEALILQRQTLLERTRCAIAILKRESEPLPQAAVGSPVEVINGRAALLRSLGWVRATARHELRCLTSAALIGSGLELTPPSARVPGARRLHVMDSGAAAGCAAFEQLQTGAAPDDEYRCAPNIPLAVMIADRQTAWLQLQVGAEDQALLVRPSSLLDGLLAMFDMIWNQAATLHSVTHVVPVTAQAPTALSLSSDLEELIPFLAAGLADKAIAHRLRISVRTLIRRVAKLLTVLDARSRFQAGWTTALRLHGLSVPNGTHAPLAAPEANSNDINGNQTLRSNTH